MSESGPPIAYVGRISADEGVFLLVGAFPGIAAQVPGLELVVVGDGPARPLLELLAAALGRHDLADAETVLSQAAQPADEPGVAALVGSWRSSPLWPPGPLNIRFAGQLEAADVADQMAAVDVVVIPSLVREAFPLVVHEALASGVPPLAVDAYSWTQVGARLESLYREAAAARLVSQ